MDQHPKSRRQVLAHLQLNGLAQVFNAEHDWTELGVLLQEVVGMLLSRFGRQRHEIMIGDGLAILCHDIFWLSNIIKSYQ